MAVSGGATQTHVGWGTRVATDEDFEAFRRVVVEAHRRHPLRILAYCILPNHWHFLVWLSADHEVMDYFRWLAHTHAMRWRVAHRKVGQGHLYQGRFKSFPVQCDEHFLTVARYVERNALSAGLVERADQWPYGSVVARSRAADPTRAILADWPIGRPAGRVERVNATLSARDLKRLRLSVARGRPFGEESWADRTARLLGLKSTLRPEGRPPKGMDPESELLPVVASPKGKDPENELRPCCRPGKLATSLLSPHRRSPRPGTAALDPYVAGCS